MRIRTELVCSSEEKCFTSTLPTELWRILLEGQSDQGLHYLASLCILKRHFSTVMPVCLNFRVFTAIFFVLKNSGAGCLKLMTSLVNFLLKFRIFHIFQQKTTADLII